MPSPTPTITVHFVDDATGLPFAVVELPPSDLPETFEVATTLHIGSDDWSVVEASPKSRAEYVASKRLTLRLARTQMLDPNTILFSLPTICDAIPAIGNEPLSGTDLVLHEDDWRQVELVSTVHASDVDEEIESIREIYEKESVESGWRRIHVRKKPEQPIACQLTLEHLARALSVDDHLNGVTYRGAASRIADGFSMTTSDGLIVYGVAPNGQVRVIAFGQKGDRSAGAATIDRVKALARDRDLELVNWCRCGRVGTDDQLFAAWLSNDVV